MELNSITTAELEVALEGLYLAPRDPEAVVDPPAEPEQAAGSSLPPTITPLQLEAALGGSYRAPRLDEVA